MVAEIIANRYELQELLGVGGMGEVYRAFDRLTQQVIALKRVRLSPGSASVNDSRSLRLSLTNEFRNLATLRHPHIITVLDYGFDAQRTPFFTMNLIEQAQHIQAALRDKTPYEQAPYWIQILQALAYLHRRNIIHRDLKPDNVLITAENIVKVLDFGLSVIHTRSQEDMTEKAAGTLTYMAPELLVGESATQSSDLYAFGVMLYEMLVGRHPYDSANVGVLINSILNQPVDVNVPELAPDIADILEKLLAKSPEDRYQHAGDVLRELALALDMPQVTETIAIRESYLEAAKFVGRDAELQRLSQAVEDTKQGKGGVYLIGGEMGVGKTRLLDELRIHALVAGASVLRGQAVRDGGTTYQVWSDVLPTKVLHVDISDEEAAILSPHIPNLQYLLRRDCEIKPLPELEPAESQRRLWRTILDINQRIELPVVIMLEDLHWESSESLGLLNYLKPHLANLPILIIGTYRSDERPDLPDLIADTHHLLLERLSETETSQLAQAMLGETGKQPALLHLLQRETEGNAFFLVEVVRSLAMDAGQLNAIGSNPLPQRILAGGIEQILQRRLAQIPQDSRLLLTLAAISGRQLDLNLLSHLEPERDLDDWLNIGLGAAVLEVREQEWRFSHDRLRDRLLLNLGEAEHRALHERVALVMELLYADDPARTATLAYMWHQAGDCDKNLYYAVKAGQQQLEHGVNDEAAEFFDQALECLQRIPPSIDRDLQEMRVQFLLSLALTTVKGYSAPDVENALLRAQQLCQSLGDSNQLFRILFGLTSVYSSRGDLAKAYQHALKLADIARETQSAEHILVSHSVQGWVLFRMGKTLEAHTHLEAAVELYDVDEHRSLGILYGQDSGLTSLSYGAMILAEIGYLDQAREYARRSFELADRLDYPAARIFAEFYSGGMLYQFMEDLEPEYAALTRVLEMDEEYGFPFFKAMAMMVRGQVRIRMGDGQAGLDEMSAGVALWQVLGGDYDANWLRVTAVGYMHLGLLNEAQQYVDRAIQRAEVRQDGYGLIDFYRIKGEILHLEDEYVRAEETFRYTLQMAQDEGVHLPELLAAISLCRLWQQQGRIEEALSLLQDTLDWFDEGFDATPLRRAQTLLDELIAASSETTTSD